MAGKLLVRDEARRVVVARPGDLHSEPVELAAVGPYGSHILTSMLGAQALAIIPRAGGTVGAAARAPIEPLELFSWGRS